MTDEANKHSSFYKVAKNKSCIEHANKDKKKDKKQDKKDKKDPKKDNNKGKKQDHKKGK